MAPGSGMMSKFIPTLRSRSTDLQAAAAWGVAAGTGALWLVQPFTWIKKTFLEKPEEAQ